MVKFFLYIIKFLVVITIFAVVTIITANSLFNRKVNKEVKTLFSNINLENKSEIIRQEDLAGLPFPVQKWLENSGVVGKEKIQSVRLKQKLMMKTDESKPWMPAHAEQYFTVEKPSFIWKAKVSMAPMLFFTGLDKYYEGHGKMEIKVLSLIPVVDSQGKEIDQSTLLRYLGEIIWFPPAALRDYIKWESIDEVSAKATMSYKGVSASAMFYFNEKGEVINFNAKRYMEKDGQYLLEDWGGVPKEYKEFNGIKIPNKGEVLWRLKTGDFTWLQYEITEIEYNKPLIY